MVEREDTIERIERVLKLTHKKSIKVTIPRLTAERAVSMLKEQEVKEQISDAIHETAKQFRRTIVRCKDCKHRDPQDHKCDCGHDIQWQLPRADNWFCADGERR